MNRNLVIEQVNRQFITTNIPGAAKREAEVIRSLEFLGLVDLERKPTNKLRSLRAVGEEFKKNLRAVVEAAYDPFLRSVDVKTLKRESLVSYFMRTYDLSQRRAEKAVKLFVALCKDSGVELPSVRVAPALNLSRPMSFAELKQRIQEHLKTALGVEEFSISYAKLEEDVWKVNVEFKDPLLEMPTTALFSIDASSGEVKEYKKGYAWGF